MTVGEARKVPPVFGDPRAIEARTLLAALKDLRRAAADTWGDVCGVDAAEVEGWTLATIQAKRDTLR